MKFYELVEMLDEETFKPLGKRYNPTDIKLLKKTYENLYPDRIFKIFVRKK